MSPEQVAKQKVETKAMELEQADALRSDPSMLSPMDALREALMPQRPKLKPVPKMKLLSNNGEILGTGEVTKGQNGTVLNPYGSKKTRGLNPHKVMMGQGSGMMGNGQSKALKKNSMKEQNAR
jgi:hypothetical protein